MLSKERLFRIMEIIEEKAFVTIQELMTILNASKSTISRDLLELEKQGLIQRERGGAIKKELPETLSSFTDLPVMDKENIHAIEKDAICRRASTLVKDGDCVYIDSGTTPKDLLQYLKAKNIKLVTSSMFLVRKLPKNFQGELLLIGGHYIPSYDMSVGFLTISDIEKFHFDHAFFSASGVELESGEVMAVDLDISEVKAAVLKRCKHAHLLIDHSKLSVQAVCTWAHLDDFEDVYMDPIKDHKKLPAHFILCEA